MADEAPPDRRPRDVRWRDEAPKGKLDLLVSMDFRMTSTMLYSDVLLPAATWYEKHDLSSTDLHPFVNAFTPAVPPPWQARTDFDAIHALARTFAAMAATRLGVRHDVVAVPLTHDTPDELASPHGVPADTGPRFVLVERDYGAVAEKLGALGPRLETHGAAWKGVTVDVREEVALLARLNGTVRGGVADGRPALTRDVHACEMILALSGTTNGRLAVAGFEVLQQRTGVHLADLAADHAGERISFADVQRGPVATLTSQEWSGNKHGGRRYAPFTTNTERDKPWHTLTGRQHFFLDHAWMSEMGEGLPVYRPPVDKHRLCGDPRLGADGELEITVRYLTPHSKWSIHSGFQDNLIMQTLSRGGPTIWMSEGTAAAIDVHDNDWIEAVNLNGVVVARAVVTHRMPDGVVYMYHAQERLIGVPRAQSSGRRGGTHNALTRLMIKPTHLVGGYAQLTFGLNYLGPTGHQRDEVTVIRRRRQEVEY